MISSRPQRGRAPTASSSAPSAHTPASCSQFSLLIESKYARATAGASSAGTTWPSTYSGALPGIEDLLDRLGDLGDRRGSAEERAAVPDRVGCVLLRHAEAAREQQRLAHSGRAAAPHLVVDQQIREHLIRKAGADDVLPPVALGLQELGAIADVELDALGNLARHAQIPLAQDTDVVLREVRRRVVEAGLQLVRRHGPAVRPRRGRPRLRLAVLGEAFADGVGDKHRAP